MPARGRPRQFDPDQALRMAMLAFWTRGYLGTSLDDLTAAMGINRASLYSTFGDKERLFLSCVDLYMQDHGAGPREALAQDRIDSALRGFFRAVIINSTGDQTPPGCLVACVLVGAIDETAKITAKLQQFLNDTDAMLQTRLDRAVREEELLAGTDTASLAKVINSFRHGLTIRARSGESRTALLATADQATRMLLSCACAPKRPIAIRSPVNATVGADAPNRGKNKRFR